MRGKNFLQTFEYSKFNKINFILLELVPVILKFNLTIISNSILKLRGEIWRIYPLLN